jgi:hypothetical protein
MQIGSILDLKKASFFQKAVLVIFFVPLLSFLSIFLIGYLTRIPDSGPMLDGRSLLEWVVLMDDDDGSAKRILSQNREVIMPVAAGWVHRTDSFPIKIYSETMATFVGKRFNFPLRGIPRYGVKANYYKMIGIDIMEEFGNSMPVAVETLKQIVNEPPTKENEFHQKRANMILKKWAGKE